MKLAIPVTPKIHAIFDHIAEFCQKRGIGLGNFSEQASESVHHDFQKTWERYAMPLGHKDFGKHLCQAVVKYNSQHI